MQVIIEINGNSQVIETDDNSMIEVRITRGSKRYFMRCQHSWGMFRSQVGEIDIATGGHIVESEGEMT